MCIRDRYWAQRKGQAKLDKEAAALPAEEQPAKPTKFETDKEKLRQAIRTALSSTASYGEFAAVLLQQGVTVKESRGRLSYLTPDRTKPITARKLGDDFDKAAVLALLTQNAHKATEQTKAIPEYLVAVKKPSQGEKPTKTTPADNTLSLIHICRHRQHQFFHASSYLRPAFPVQTALPFRCLS